ncbi:subclass B1 metallo-beta-lactamase [Flagellimonas flava]|uniref:beta-lactamase n=1 Tax=Flagellimonas flava TaxID=570519 RepID=A0A1M5ICD4_9FLAO|nr:subclass B1 metallo-beta-lactamase [Allomuricauda flava]SHG25907.1 metallo-beta-lactamase class B [Allomuricauda flava]
MKHLALYFLITLAFTGCKQEATVALHTSETLVIEKLSANTYVHISYLQTDSFGNVACNGLIYKNGNEVIVFDTPTTDAASEELLTWISSELKAKVVAIVPTHSHDDCLGGLVAFHEAGIPSIANSLTKEFALKNEMTVPQKGFQHQTNIRVGNESVSCIFVGPGHTLDNIIGYIPAEEVLFGGCLLKSLGAGKGYLGEADVPQWPITVNKVKTKFPNLKWVVPGHGKSGKTDLLDYTITLFQSENKTQDEGNPN